jgi:hypothetical protein
LSHLVNQVSIHEFVALSFEESGFDETIEFLPGEAFSGERLGAGLGRQQECGGHVFSWLLYLTESPTAHEAAVPQRGSAVY